MKVNIYHYRGIQYIKIFKNIELTYPNRSLIFTLKNTSKTDKLSSFSLWRYSAQIMTYSIKLFYSFFVLLFCYAKPEETSCIARNISPNPPRKILSNFYPKKGAGDFWNLVGKLFYMLLTFSTKRQKIKITQIV